jgi:hypothetical protein
MPPKKAAPAAATVPTKASFFMTKRVMEANMHAKTQQDPKSLRDVKKDSSSFGMSGVPKRRFLYDKETAEAYAEVVGDAAMCLETGVELFRFNRNKEDDGCYGAVSSQCAPCVKFDFTPPVGKRHPDERFVDVMNLVKAGIISESDVAAQRAFSDAELRGFMVRLDAYLHDADGEEQAM